MTSITKKVYIDLLDDIVHTYNDTYHNTIKIKTVDVKSSTYIDSSNEINNRDPKFKVGDIVRVSKYKSIFTKNYDPNSCEEVFAVKKVKNTVPWTYVIRGLKGEKIVGTFSQKRIEKKKSKSV